jgi:hypothetical protein
LVDTFNLYISAADDLLSERDLLSRTVTEIPVTLGWKINFSPFGRKTLVEKHVINANFHILMLGTDIRAPIGFELHLSLRQRRKPILFLKNGIARTPAAADFHRSLSNHNKWHPFQDLSDLRHMALGYIGQYILDQAKFFSLGSNEYDQLSEFLKNLKDSGPGEIELAQGDAGENSIILSRERFTPRNGVLIQPPDISNREDTE